MAVSIIQTPQNILNWVNGADDITFKVSSNVYPTSQIRTATLTKNPTSSNVRVTLGLPFTVALKVGNLYSISSVSYNGVYRVVSITSGTVFVIDAIANSISLNETANVFKFYKSYKILAQIYVGLPNTYNTAYSSLQPQILADTKGFAVGSNGQTFASVESAVQTQFGNEDNGSPLNNGVQLQLNGFYKGSFVSFYVVFSEQYLEANANGILELVNDGSGSVTSQTYWAVNASGNLKNELFKSFSLAYKNYPENSLLNRIPLLILDKTTDTFIFVHYAGNNTGIISLEYNLYGSDLTPISSSSIITTENANDTFGVRVFKIPNANIFVSNASYIQLSALAGINVIENSDQIPAETEILPLQFTRDSCTNTAVIAYRNLLGAYDMLYFDGYEFQSEPETRIGFQTAFEVRTAPKRRVLELQNIQTHGITLERYNLDSSYKNVDELFLSNDVFLFFTENPNEWLPITVAKDNLTLGNSTNETFDLVVNATFQPIKSQIR